MVNCPNVVKFYESDGKSYKLFDDQHLFDVVDEI